MVPKFIQRLRRAVRVNALKRRKERAIHKTSFLDGLRGVAALIVVINHHCMNYKRYFQEPFTFGPYEEGENAMDFTNPLQLPFFRIAITGGAMVPIFFVISGYVLAFRQIRMIRQQSFDALADSLFSSAFRRPFRLFLPSIAGIVIFQVMNELGWNPLWDPSKHWLRPLPNIMWSIAMLFDGIWGIVPERHGTYLQQLWTIPLEFFGSMCIFVMLIANSRLKPTWRKATIITSLILSYYTGHWPLGTFLGGMLIAELETLPEDERELLDRFEAKKAEVETPVRDLLFNTFWFSNLVMGLWIAGWPEASFHKDPVLSKIALITPAHLAKEHVQVKWFWLGVSGLQIVWCIFQSPALQRIFTTRVALYLADVSYAMYVVHYHVTLSVGPWIHKCANRIWGEDRGSHFSQLVAVTFELSVILFIVFWEADLFWRYVDQPCVMLAKWIEKKART